MNQKIVVEIPLEEYNAIKSALDKILTVTENMGKSALPEMLSRKEFMAEAKIGHNKMNQLLRSRKLKFNRVGPRLISIPTEELMRFKRGEIN